MSEYRVYYDAYKMVLKDWESKSVTDLELKTKHLQWCVSELTKMIEEILPEIAQVNNMSEAYKGVIDNHKGMIDELTKKNKEYEYIHKISKADMIEGSFDHLVKTVKENDELAMRLGQDSTTPTYRAKEISKYITMLNKEMNQLYKENTNSGKIIDSLRKTAEEKRLIINEYKDIHRTHVGQINDLKEEVDLLAQHDKTIESEDWEKEKALMYIENEKLKTEVLVLKKGDPETEVTYLRRIVENASKCIKE